MQVFFTATTANTDLQKNYKKILSFLKRKKLNVVSGRQIIDKKLLEKEKNLSPEIIFDREKKLIENSDFIIAEVTTPSTAVGGQIVYALTKNIPVLALIYRENEDKITPMILGNPSDSLYTEHYDSENLDFVLNNFLKHIQNLSKKRGMLIVLDGGDGSGKTTQAKLLIEYFQKKKIPVKYMDFPRYYLSFHGATVGKFLRGEFGTIDQVSPYLASLAYALDRAGAKDEMVDFLNKGGMIIANRYATSSLGHQMSKFKTQKEKDDFYKWIIDLEYKTHKIPKEDLVIYLHVPCEISYELTNHKDGRQYLKGKKTDIHEENMQYRIEVEKTFLDLADKEKHWVKIDCTKNNKILSVDDIHIKIVAEIEKTI